MRQQVAEAEETIAESRWPQISYEGGVEAALLWVLGDTTDAPMEEELAEAD